MSPTLLEGTVALVLVWLGWRIAVILTPCVLSRFRLRFRPPAGRNAEAPKDHPTLKIVDKD